MTLRDDLLPVIDDARQLVEDFGLRRFGVAVETIVYSAPINTPGAAVASTEQTIISPRPRVTQVGSESAALVMASLPASASGRGYRLIYEITGITPTFSTGGYSLIELVRPTQPTPSVAVHWLLWGADDLGDDIASATRFDTLKVTEKAFRYTFLVGMVDQ